MTDRAIVMTALGDRPWATVSFEGFKRKAQEWEADAFLVTEDFATDLDLSDLSDNAGRPNKRAYALKSYLPWYYLTKMNYASVLMVDDSCVIHPGAPNIFDEYADAQLALTGTSPDHAAASYKHIEDLVTAGRIAAIDPAPKLYGNTGVVLYRSEVAGAFSPDRIQQARECLISQTPHQTLFYYLHRWAGIDPVMIEKDWNRIPAMSLSNQERRALTSARPYIDHRFKIAHFTGTFRKRDEAIPDLAEYFDSLQVNENVL